MPKPGETYGSPQFPGSALLTAGDVDRAVKACLGGDFVIRPREVQFTAETVQLGLLKTLVVLLHECEGLVESAVRFIEATQ
jgi:hypothetical protein